MNVLSFGGPDTSEEQEYAIPDLLRAMSVKVSVILNYVLCCL